MVTPLCLEHFPDLSGQAKLSQELHTYSIVKRVESFQVNSVINDGYFVLIEVWVGRACVAIPSDIMAEARRKFIGSLRDAVHEQPALTAARDASASDDPSLTARGADVSSKVDTVKFTLKNLRKFRAMASNFKSFAATRETARKRPSYDNSRRRARAALNLKQRRIKPPGEFVSGGSFSRGLKVEACLSCCRHAVNGKCMVRVQGLVDRAACACHRGRCFEKFTERLDSLEAFLDLFWGLEKPAQDMYAAWLEDLGMFRP